MRAYKQKVDVVLERAREELPPLPPPLTSGWRPVPSVGGGPDAGFDAGRGGAGMGGGGMGGGGDGGGWMQTGGDRGNKRPREEGYGGVPDGYARSSYAGPPPPPPPPPGGGGGDRGGGGGYGGGYGGYGGGGGAGAGAGGGGGGYGEVGPPGYGGRDGYGQDYTRALPPPPPGRSTYVEVGAGIIRPPGERGNAPPPRKVGNCFDWQRGICTRGEGCKFSHGEHFDGGSQYSRDPPPPRRENPTWDGTRLY